MPTWTEMLGDRAIGGEKPLSVTRGLERVWKKPGEILGTAAWEEPGMLLTLSCCSLPAPPLFGRLVLPPYGMDGLTKVFLTIVAEAAESHAKWFPQRRELYGDNMR